MPQEALIYNAESSVSNEPKEDKQSMEMVETGSGLRTREVRAEYVKMSYGPPQTPRLART